MAQVMMTLRAMAFTASDRLGDDHVFDVADAVDLHAHHVAHFAKLRRLHGDAVMARDDVDVQMEDRLAAGLALPPGCYTVLLTKEH